jgi:hypothetical protein
MYQCPHCHEEGISAMALFSMGKRMSVRCKSCGILAYRKLPLAIEVLLSLILTIFGGALILTKGEPMLLVVWLLGTLMVMMLASHLFGKMIPYEGSQP